MYTGNALEDRFIGNIDRRVGTRVSGRTVGNVEYTPSSKLVFRNGQWVSPTPTPVVRPTAPVVKKPAPIVAKVVEAEAPKSPFTKMFTELAPLANRIALQSRFMTVRDALVEESEDSNSLPRNVRFPGNFLDDINEATAWQLEDHITMVVALERKLADVRETKRLANKAVEEKSVRRILAGAAANAKDLEALRKRHNEKPVTKSTVNPPEDFTPMDLSRPKSTYVPRRDRIKVKEKKKAKRKGWYLS